MRFKDKKVVITGAAGGIGRSCALMFAKEGATVAVLDRDLSALTSVSRATSAESGGKCHAFQIDVASVDSVESVMQLVVRELGRVDVLINAAGVNSRVHFLELSELEWDRVIDINLKGTFLISQYCARLMRDQQSGVIVNVASIAAQVIRREGFSVYPVSKAGVQALTKAMAAALGPFNVRVNAVGPGPISTAMTADRASTPEGRASLLSGVIRRRMGTPVDVGKAILFLASEDADFVTGTTLYVDGGVLVGTATDSE